MTALTWSLDLSFEYPTHTFQLSQELSSLNISRHPELIGSPDLSSENTEFQVKIGFQINKEYFFAVNL